MSVLRTGGDGSDARAMSITVMDAVWRHSEAKAAELLTLLAIADCADDEGFAFPSYDFIAVKTRSSKRSAQNRVKGLLGTDELSLVSRGTQGRSNEYAIQVAALRAKPVVQPSLPTTTNAVVRSADEIEMRGRDEGRGGKSLDPGGNGGSMQVADPGGKQAATEPSSSTVREPSGSEPGADEPPALFTAPAEAQSSSPAPASATGDDLVLRVWHHYVEVFGTDHMRIKELTPARATSIRKAIKATDVPACCAAIDGLKSYRTKNPQGSQDISLGAIFETRPGGRNLTDQIEFWASQADVRMNSSSRRVPLDLSGVSAVFAGQIKARRLDVVRYHRTENPDTERRVQENIAWLREHAGWEPYTDNDGKLRWRYVDAD